MSAPLTLVEAINQYMDACKRLASMVMVRGEEGRIECANATAALTEAVERMDELAPNPERK